MKPSGLGTFVLLLGVSLAGCASLRGPLPSRSFVTHPRGATHVILGRSGIDIGAADKYKVGIQTDRGVRDIFWDPSAFDARVPHDRIPTEPGQLVPYMEGLRAAEIMRWGSATVRPLSPSIVKKGPDGGWYGSDGEGNFRFGVFPDKVAYPTTRPFVKNGEAYAEIFDTHGFSAIAAPAIAAKNRDGLDLAIACMDSPNKAAAALFLATRNISCYAPCDRYANILMGYRERYGIEAAILGSAPVKRNKTGEGCTIGRQPVKFSLTEPIVAQYTDKLYPDQYCDAPWRYLNALNSVYGLKLKIRRVTANVGQTALLTREAVRIGASVIAARVFDESDYRPLKTWMDAAPGRRLILLHSAAYDFGMAMFLEYPDRVTFGDLSPVFVSERPL